MLNNIQVQCIATNIIDFGVRNHAGRLRKLAETDKTMLMAIMAEVISKHKIRGAELLNFVQKELYVRK